MDASHKVIQQHKTTELTVRDWERFNDILTDASEPNKELKTALREHESRVST